MIKKISALFLALVLCLSVMVVPASAYELPSGSKIAYIVELDKESYNAGEYVTVSLYIYGDPAEQFNDGAIVLGMHSDVFDMAENDANAIRDEAVIGETVGTFFKNPADGASWAWQTNATILNNIKTNNTEEENTLYDQYLKFPVARRGTSDGEHENSPNTKLAFPGSELNEAAEAGEAFYTFQLKLRDDIADGTVINIGVPEGPMAKNYTYLQYMKTPGTGTTKSKTTAADSDVVWARATIGEPAVHECTPAEAVQENVIPATCGADGSHDDVVYCSSCGKELSRTPVVDKSTGEHVYATVVKEVPATCTEDGSVTKACGCGAEETTAVPATGHTETKAVTRPTCTEGGYTTYTCKTCGNTRTADETPAKGHDYREKVTAPTCTEAGYTTFTCPFCKDSYTGNPVEATGHNYESVVTAPTCTEDGYTTYTCSVCSDTYTSDVVPATGHTYEVTAVKQPTCSKDGFTRYTCACGDTYDEPIPTTNHTNPDGTSALVEIPAVPATCKAEGKTAGQKCSICNSVVVSPETVEKLPHAWVAGEVVAPTYNEQGYTTYTCSVCSDTKKDDYTDKLVGVEVEIEAPESTQVNEGESVTLKAPVTAEGFRVEWTADNANFTMTQNEDGSVTLTPAANGDSVITVTVYDADGNEVSSDSIVMTAVVEDAGDDDGEEEPWWKKLINWIISLFKKLVEIIVNLVSSLVS